MQIALISVENKKMEISHKLFTSWLNDLTLIGSEDVIKEILRRNLQKFHSLFCKALGLLQGTFPSMLAPRFVSAATSLIRSAATMERVFILIDSSQILQRLH